MWASLDVISASVCQLSVERVSKRFAPPSPFLSLVVLGRTPSALETGGVSRGGQQVSLPPRLHGSVHAY